MSYRTQAERFTHVADVESHSTPGKYYEVKQDTQTGWLSCSCPAWRFQRLPTNERRCKHTTPLMDRTNGDPDAIRRLSQQLAALPTGNVFRNESDLQAAVLEAML